MSDKSFQHTEQVLTSKNGLKLFTQAWLPNSTPQANLIIVHGLGEHSGRYAHVASFFTEKSLAVFAFDFQGHGQSEGKRGHVESFSNFVDDLEQFRWSVNEWSPDKPTLLYGHSMGALVVFLYLLDYQQYIKAAILSSPPLRVKMGPPKFIKDMVPSLARRMPSFTINSGLKPEWVSRDQHVVDAYKQDPLTHSRISLSLFAGMYTGGQKALEKADKITLPVFLLYGSDDKIVDGAAIDATFEKIASQDKKKMVFQDDYHEVHNEADQQDEFDALWEWLAGK